MIMIHFQYSVKMDDVQVKSVVCENCQCEYYYAMRRTASGYSSSPSPYSALSGQIALWLARHKLKRRMQECEPSACPDCGWYQRDMVTALASRWYGWLFWLALIIGGWSIVEYRWAPGAHAVQWVLAALTCLGLWLILRVFHLPNATAFKRTGHPKSPDKPVFDRSEVLDMMNSEEVDPFHRAIFRDAMERFDKNPPQDVIPSALGSHRDGFISIEIQKSKQLQNNIMRAVVVVLFAILMYYAFDHSGELYQWVRQRK